MKTRTKSNKKSKLTLSKGHKVLIVLAVLLVAAVAWFFINRQLSQAEARFSWVDTDFRDSTVKLCKFNAGSTAKYRIKVVAVGATLQWVQVKVKSSGQTPHVYPRITSDKFGSIFTKDEYGSGAHIFYDVTAHYNDNTDETKTINKNQLINCDSPRPRAHNNDGGSGNGGGSGGGSGNNQGTTRQLAQRILHHPNIIFSDGAIVPMRAVANGRPAPVNGDNAPNTQTSVNPNLLRFILALADAVPVQVRISSFTNGTHERPTSAHYTGEAIDIGNEEDAGAMRPWIRAHRAEYGINSVMYTDDCIHVALR